MFNDIPVKSLKQKCVSMKARDNFIETKRDYSATVEGLIQLKACYNVFVFRANRKILNCI